MKPVPDPETCLLLAMMRGKDLPIERLAPEEWAFTLWNKKQFPRSEHDWCYQYEFQREFRRNREEIGNWRDRFNRERAQNMRQWEEEYIQQQKEEGIVVPKPPTQQERDAKNRYLDDAYKLGSEYGCDFWLLRDFPEFPAVPWLKLPLDLRKRRLVGKKYGKVTEPDRLEDYADQLKVFTDILGRPLPEEKASGLLPEQAAEEARRRYELEEKSPSRYLDERFKEILPGTFVSWHVIKIEWKFRNKQLVRQFEQFLKTKSPPRRELWAKRTRGGISTLEKLKLLSAFRLMRHCRGNWKLAAEMSARICPKGKPLYANQAAWSRAAKRMQESLELAFNADGFDPIR
ncbi:MAG: hypothetical protein HZA88_15225 [Verrucomicrobia bacterium]|nr:hypothetical protein [Verrucomicrobiota bacterium]